MSGIRRGPIVDELKVEPANGGRFAEHLRLKVTSLVPSWLSAHSGVERENEPPSLAAFSRGIERSDLA
jgi:hypothetical protein